MEKIMTKNNGVEFGAVYRDPSLKIGRGDVFKTAEPKPTPSAAELDLKANRDPEDGYDLYGFYDPKLRLPSMAKTASQRRMVVYAQQI